uniref:Uncharacterized protein n=1 Tax=Lepeophtheirus salmonis TaxID=72036 RepID=A0A0K2TRM7_LEPSM
MIRNGYCVASVRGGLEGLEPPFKLRNFRGEVSNHWVL